MIKSECEIKKHVCNDFFVSIFNLLCTIYQDLVAFKLIMSKRSESSRSSNVKSFRSKLTDNLLRLFLQYFLIINSVEFLHNVITLQNILSATSNNCNDHIFRKKLQNYNFYDHNQQYLQSLIMMIFGIPTSHSYA